LTITIGVAAKGLGDFEPELRPVLRQIQDIFSKLRREKLSQSSSDVLNLVRVWF
jgi:hypothetical protein